MNSKIINLGNSICSQLNNKLVTELIGRLDKKVYMNCESYFQVDDNLYNQLTISLTRQIRQSIYT